MNQYLVVGVVFLVVIALLATNKKLVETLKNIYDRSRSFASVSFTRSGFCWSTAWVVSS